ncbi:hypothetical protein [Methanonatronarchaeum sp. AMET-Sl]|uniref:hypothetical protein n=1 Tax=Methanonatronarchaeum sp. AMET-Sl TaxID=3037654 RepID=UPI00244E2070|nr:hypothetical protein [Methanonatronarchaeum sp. AMET-Sl]WGI17645.1 hypothetical protein QEN48_01150 [Methanonatronarchaeum sp. AMET-Sl]
MVDKKQWNNLVEQRNLGSLLHRYEWIKSAKESLNNDFRHIFDFKKQNPIGIFLNAIKKIKLTPFKAELRYL